MSVKRYWVECGSCECAQNGSETIGGKFVCLEADFLQMRFDYAALEAERDAMRQRCEGMEKVLEKCVAFHKASLSKNHLMRFLADTCAKDMNKSICEYLAAQEKEKP